MLQLQQVVAELQDQQKEVGGYPTYCLLSGGTPAVECRLTKGLPRAKICTVICDWCREPAVGQVELVFEDGERRVLDLCDKHLEMLRATSKTKSPATEGGAPIVS